ncbi:MAG: hypothetical protein ACOYNP_19250 [Gemmataceae bacterium]
MRHIRRILFALAFMSSGIAFGQITEDPEDRDRDNQGREPLRTQTPEGRPLPFSQRLRFGGGVSALQLGNPRLITPFVIGLSPIVAYQATERLVLGVGVNYLYSRWRAETTQGQRITLAKSTQYGGRGFGMYEIVPNIVSGLYAHAEIESTSFEPLSLANGTFGTRQTITAPLLGLTYSQRVGRLAGINVSALYNLNYSSQSAQVYNSPFVFRIMFF